MGSVQQTRTKPEMIVRGALHAEGYRYRANVRGLPGSPDIAFIGRRKAIFIHGCFWHRHPGCKLATSPKTRSDFWEAKFAANVERDARKLRELIEEGWNVATVWGCETSNVVPLLDRLRKFLGPPKSTTPRAE